MLLLLLVVVVVVAVAVAVAAAANLFVAKWFLADLISTGGCTWDAVQSVDGEDKQYKKLWINPFGSWSLYYYHDGSVILTHETGKTCLLVCSLQCVNNNCYDSSRKTPPGSLRGKNVIKGF